MKKFFSNLPKNSRYCFYQTKVNRLLLIACDQYLRAILHSSNYDLTEFLSYKFDESNQDVILKDCCLQLDEYFLNKRIDFDVPLYLDGTDFQKTAWQALTNIEYGKTISYQDQAIALGDAKKCRAVGMANSKNPISIIVPCHRVIAKNGSLHGYGGGLTMKKYLLQIEMGPNAV